MKKDIKTLNKIIGMVRDSQRETPEDKLREGLYHFRDIKMTSRSPEATEFVKLSDALAILNEAVADKGAMIKALTESLNNQTDKVVEWRDKYHELIFVVENKYENESRHETALRYIKTAEKGHNEGSKRQNNESKM